MLLREIVGGGGAGRPPLLCYVPVLYHAAVSLREVQAALVVQDMHGIGEKSWAYRWTEYVESCGQRPHMPTL